jgi:hypothetical protein
LLPAALVASVGCAVPAAVPSASAAAPRVVGGLDYAYQNSASTMLVSGWAFDRAHPNASLAINLRVDGGWRRTVVTTVYRAAINDRYHVGGRHGFFATLSFVGGWPSGSFVGMRWPSGNYLAGRWITPMGTRIVREAAKFVGARYVYGGASPSGFDCSGYSQYVYRAVRAGTLVHNSQGQFQQVHPVSASRLRPGDLIFYLSGGTSYHVAVYSGGGPGLYQGWEYAAATPGQGVVHEHIWSRSIRFGTTWHWT